MSAYRKFLDRKRISAPTAGFEPSVLHPGLFPHARDIASWACRRGRAALFEDCGLMKTSQQLAWANEVNNHTWEPVLMLAPLMVVEQIQKEARDLWGMDIHMCASQADVKPGVNVTNYEKLHKFDSSAFSGIACDESGILKSFDGKTRNQVIDFSRSIPYRLAATATPSPNDYTELGNHAEFLGIMSMAEMLSTFFIHDGGETSKWRLKGHAEDAFHEWLSKFAVFVRKPSDLEYPDDGFDLPALDVIPHILDCGPSEGFLFPMEARTLAERRGARRSSIGDKVKEISGMINSDREQWIVWCGLNDESKALAAAIPGCVEITGKAAVADRQEESRRDAMAGFISGRYRVLVTKGKIAGWGVNLQFCHNMAMCSLSDSAEEFYQIVRRCWRFGQKSKVNVHVFLAETEAAVLRNVERKQREADILTTAMVRKMKDFSKREIRSAHKDQIAYLPQRALTIPEWMR